MTVKPSDLKILFAGSGPFAEPVFESLANEFPELELIVKFGAKEDPEIVKIAKKYNIPFSKAAEKNDFHEKIEEIKPDIAVVVSFGIIISGATLEIPKHGFINIHYSLLPKYRGPSPVQSAILAGESKTGITFQKMAERIDAGEIIYQEEMLIKTTDTTESLGQKMAEISAQKLPQALLNYISGATSPKIQNEKEATYTKIIKKSDGKVNWNEPAEIIERKVRTYTPWPGTYTFWNGKTLKILEAEVIESKSELPPGTFYEIKKCTHPVCTKFKHAIQTGKGSIVPRKLQLEGKKPLSIGDFLLGYSKIVGSKLD